MQDAIFIIFVVFLLFGLTAIRYRKQIAGMIGLARMLKDAKNAVGQGKAIPGKNQASVQLINCAKCGVWVPQNKARKVGNIFYCSESCLKMSNA